MAFPNENLSDKTVKTTYQRLLQIYNEYVYDGTGSLVDLKVSGSILIESGSIILNGQNVNVIATSFISGSINDNTLATTLAINQYFQSQSKIFYEFTQSVAANNWYIDNPLLRPITVITLDDTNQELIGDIIIDNNYSVTASFSKAITGKAFLT